MEILRTGLPDLPKPLNTAINLRKTEFLTSMFSRKTGKFSPPNGKGKGGDGPTGEEASTPLSDDNLPKESIDEESGLGNSPAPAPA